MLVSIDPSSPQVSPNSKYWLRYTHFSPLETLSGNLETQYFRSCHNPRVFCGLETPRTCCVMPVWTVVFPHQTRNFVLYPESNHKHYPDPKILISWVMIHRMIHQTSYGYWGFGLLHQLSQSFKETCAERAVKDQKMRVEQSHDQQSYVKEYHWKMSSFSSTSEIFFSDCSQMVNKSATSMPGSPMPSLDVVNFTTYLIPNHWVKLRLYVEAVCSILTYGCETWVLTDRMDYSKNQCVNSRMVARITGQNIVQEARRTTCSFNLVQKNRQRRLR